MKILICIDDTDNHASKGTGDLAERLAAEIINNNWGTAEPITRHQLFFHPAIPYTSHNSAMCFAAEIAEGTLEKIIAFSAAFLSGNSAPGSDPGLGVTVLNRLADARQLIDFGLRAKSNILTKQEAYRLAAREPAVFLSEHGGTGDGVIGALAGIGLRLSGNDGRFKGKYYEGHTGKIMTVRSIIAGSNIQEVRIEGGELLGAEEKVLLGEKVKSVLLNGRIVLPVEANSAAKGAMWVTLGREKIRKF